MKKIKIRLWVKIVLVIIILSLSFFFYSKYLGPKGLIVKEYGVINKNIPENFYGFKIVQISDIHYKVTTDLDDLNNMVYKINLLKPDIVIFSGDLLDDSIKYTDKDYKDLINIFKTINCNVGKYAIKGENDNNDRFEEIINNSDFIDLDDKYEFIYSNGLEPILLVGISSNYKDNHIKNTLDSIYSEINTEYKYSILILHEPDFINDIEYNKFNLILAGHSHNGQIVLPFIGSIIKNKYSTNYTDNYYNLNNTSLYISSGIGTNKYKYRFLNKPSINFYRLRNK